MHRYQLVSQIGDGAFGVVARATVKDTGEVVAVKKMKQRFASWEECMQLREVLSLRKVQHPNIIKLKEVVRENTELFLVFELMDLNVFDLTQSKVSNTAHGSTFHFDEREIRSIAIQTLSALAHIHKAGFFHRDLKPENLLTKGDVVKIADFGLAKEVRLRPPFTEYVSTRWYRAPEIILRSSSYNSPIDVWALGCIVAELFLCRPLFPGSGDSDQLFKICAVLGSPSQETWEEGHNLARRCNMRFPPLGQTPLKQIIPNASPQAIDFIEQTLRWNPQDRPTSHALLQHPWLSGPDSDFQGVASGMLRNPCRAGPAKCHAATPLPALGQPQTTNTVKRQSSVSDMRQNPFGQPMNSGRMGVSPARTGNSPPLKAPPISYPQPAAAAPAPTSHYGGGPFGSFGTSGGGGGGGPFGSFNPVYNTNTSGTSGSTASVYASHGAPMYGNSPSRNTGGGAGAGAGLGPRRTSFGPVGVYR